MMKVTSGELDSVPKQELGLDRAVSAPSPSPSKLRGKMKILSLVSLGAKLKNTAE